MSKLAKERCKNKINYNYLTLLKKNDILKLKNSGYYLKNIALMYGVHRTTIYARLRK